MKPQQKFSIVFLRLSVFLLSGGMLSSCHNSIYRMLAVSHNYCLGNNGILMTSPSKINTCCTTNSTVSSVAVGNTTLTALQPQTNPVPTGCPVGIQESEIGLVTSASTNQQTINQSLCLVASFGTVNIQAINLNCSLGGKVTLPSTQGSSAGGTTTNKISKNGNNTSGGASNAAILNQADTAGGTHQASSGSSSSSLVSGGSTTSPGGDRGTSGDGKSTTGPGGDRGTSGQQGTNAYFAPSSLSGGVAPGAESENLGSEGMKGVTTNTAEPHARMEGFGGNERGAGGSAQKEFFDVLSGMRSADPEDYFTRIGLEESLFKRVSAIYLQLKI